MRSRQQGFTPKASRPVASSFATAGQAFAALRGSHQRSAGVQGTFAPRHRLRRQALTTAARVQRDALDLADNVALPRAVATAVRENSRRETAGRARVTEKADRATVEQALDPRTRLVRQTRRAHALCSAHTPSDAGLS